MSMNISATNSPYVSGTSGAASKATATAETDRQSKPTWNPGKVYKYLEDMNDGFLEYREQAVSYYRSLTSQEEGDGTLTVDELKKQIKELFPEYTLTGSEPKNLTKGKFYLYIDQYNLNKMASDPEYRAKVYGLMDTELQGTKGYTLQYSDGRNVTNHLTGTIFSLAEKNKKYDWTGGLPYHGSCMSDNAISTSESRVMVRNQSFIYDNLNPRSTGNKKSNAVEDLIEELREKRAEKRKAERKEEAGRLQEKIEERAEERKELREQLLERFALMSAGAKYQEPSDIKMYYA